MPVLNVKIVDNDRLRHWLDRSAHFRSSVSNGTRRIAMPPMDVVRDMQAQRDFPLPSLKGVVSAPFFSPTGRLVLTPGYDAETQRFLDFPESLKGLHISPTPTETEQAAALAFLFEWLSDLPFVSPADRANLLAKLLDPFTRTITDSRTPLYAFTAPVKGTGKGLAADVVTIPATGQSAMKMPLVAGDGELEKRMLALLLGRNDHVHFDNFEGTLKSPVLASFLTSDYFGGRVMSLSKVVSLPQRINLSLSGNNVLFGGDLGRRTVLIRLDARLAQPELRRQFKHPDLLQWTKENRRSIVEACLILIQSWVNDGMPPGNATMGSFEPWAATASGILHHVGIDDLLGNRDELAQVADVVSDAWRALSINWWKEFGDRVVTPMQLVRVVRDADRLPFYLADDAGDKAISSAVGKALMKVRDRVFGDYVIRLTGENPSTGSKQWKLELQSAGEIGATSSRPD